MCGDLLYDIVSSLKVVRLEKYFVWLGHSQNIFQSLSLRCWGNAYFGYSSKHHVYDGQENSPK